MTSSCSNLAIETAVPLACCCDEVESNDAHLIVSNDDREDIKETGFEQKRTRWNCALFTLGVIGGLFVTGQAYGALKLSIFLYGENLEPPIKEDGILDFFQYAVLMIFSHLADIVYLLICIGFAWILTSTGNAFSQRLARSIFPEYCMDDNDLDFNPARSVFLLVVCLEGGFLFGASCMGLIVELYLGVPLSLGGFVCAVLVDALVCYLMVTCYDWGSLIVEVANSDSEKEVRQQEDQHYIAIV